MARSSRMKISLLTPERPGGDFIIDVAVPCKKSGFLIFKYKMKDFMKAELKVLIYLKMFREHPESIEDFHKDNVREYLRLQEIHRIL
jgi:hypothetical protein